MKRDEYALKRLLVKFPIWNRLRTRAIWAYEKTLQLYGSTGRGILRELVSRYYVRKQAQEKRNIIWLDGVSR